MVKQADHTASILPLKLENISVRIRGKKILDNVDLEVPNNRFTVIIGPNGSGKTTLLRTIHGLQRASEGTLEWNCSTPQARSQQAFVFQTPILLRRTVLGNLTYPLQIKGVKNSAAAESARNCARTVGLDAKLDMEANALSGGERQKLALARALITAPDLLILDEPTANLDGRSTRQIETILLDAHHAGTNIIMTTHDLGQAKRLADHIIFLNKGSVGEEADAGSFFDNPKTPQASAYLRGDIVE